MSGCYVGGITLNEFQLREREILMSAATGPIEVFLKSPVVRRRPIYMIALFVWIENYETLSNS